MTPDADDERDIGAAEKWLSLKHYLLYCALGRWTDRGLANRVPACLTTCIGRVKLHRKGRKLLPESIARRFGAE